MHRCPDMDVPTNRSGQTMHRGDARTGSAAFCIPCIEAESSVRGAEGHESDVTENVDGEAIEYIE